MTMSMVPGPRTRRAVGHTVDVTVAGEPGVLTVGRDHDGTPYRMELRAGVHGSTLAGLADALATAITVGLQHGVPAAVLADALHRADLGSPAEDATNLLVEPFTTVESADMIAAAGR